MAKGVLPPPVGPLPSPSPPTSHLFSQSRTPQDFLTTAKEINNARRGALLGDVTRRGRKRLGIKAAPDFLMIFLMTPRRFFIKGNILAEMWFNDGVYAVFFDHIIPGVISGQRNAFLPRKLLCKACKRSFKSLNPLQTLQRPRLLLSFFTEALKS